MSIAKNPGNIKQIDFSVDSLPLNDIHIYNHSHFLYKKFLDDVKSFFDKLVWFFDVFEKSVFN